MCGQRRVLGNQPPGDESPRRVPFLLCLGAGQGARPGEGAGKRIETHPGRTWKAVRVGNKAVQL